MRSGRCAAIGRPDRAALTQSPCWPVQRSAIAQLKRRPLEEETVPWVLAGMRWPAELEQGVLVNAQGDIVHDCALTVEGAQAASSRIERLDGVQRCASDLRHELGAPWASSSETRRFLVRACPAKRYAHRQTTYRTYANRAQQTEQQVAAYNLQVERQNVAASQLLYELTGENRGTDPDVWLDWWTAYNEVTRIGEKPAYHLDGRQRRLIHEGPVIRIIYNYLSCFPRGTLIRTQAGLTPIEYIQPGDLVLLRIQIRPNWLTRPCLQTTRRPSPLLRIHVEDEDFTATPAIPSGSSAKAGGWPSN